MSLRFKGADLRPVLTEAIANQCRIVLVKDQGVYFLAERGERRPDGRQQLLAYAVGCNPDTDPFDDWWHLAAASWVATILRSISTRRTACSRASCTRRTISCCPPPPRTCPWPWCLPPEAATAAQPSQPPHRGLSFVRTAAIAAHARSSPAAKARPAGHSAGMPPETTA